MGRQPSSPQHQHQAPDQLHQGVQQGLQQGLQQDDHPPELPPRPLNLLSLSPRHPPPPHAPAYTSHGHGQGLTQPGNNTGENIGNIGMGKYFTLSIWKYLLLMRIYSKTPQQIKLKIFPFSKWAVKVIFSSKLLKIWDRQPLMKAMVKQYSNEEEVRHCLKFWFFQSHQAL